MWPPTVHRPRTVLTDCSLFPNAGKGSSQKRHAGVRFAEFIRNRRVIIDPYKTLLVSQRGFQRGETPLCRFGWGHAGTFTTAFLSFVTPAQTSSLRADVRKQVQKRRKGSPVTFYPMSLVIQRHCWPTMGLSHGRRWSATTVTSCPRGSGQTSYKHPSVGATPPKNPPHCLCEADHQAKYWKTPVSVSRTLPAN